MIIIYPKTPLIIRCVIGFYRKKEIIAFDAHIDSNINPDSGNIKCGKKALSRIKEMQCASY